MAYQNKSNYNNRNSRPKPVFKVYKLQATGVNNNGTNYDTNSLYDIMAKLQNSGTFSMLSVPVTMDKKICLDRDDVKGSMTVARIQSYDIEVGEVNVMFFTKTAEYAKKAEGMSIVPRVRVGRDSDQVITILGFDLVTL